MSGLFKKRNRKFQLRETRIDSDEEIGPTSTNQPRNKLEGKPPILSDNDNSGSSSVFTYKDKEGKGESSISKVKTLLSFQDEEEGEGETFKLKKSNYSRRLAKQRERERKKREASLNAPFELSESKPDTFVRELKSKESLKVFAGNEAEDMEVDSEEEKEKANPFKNVLQSGVIPDAATIYAMKKHRQMAREMGEFIPLEDEDKNDENKSRLIRDDDNDRSDDDDEPSRINFTINTGAVERQKLRETFLSLQEGSTKELENEDAAELDRWEREQIKKGVGVIQMNASDSSEGIQPLMFASSPADTISYASNNHANRVPSYAPSTELLLGPKESTMTTEDIKDRIAERLGALKTLHEDHKQEIEYCQKELVECEKAVAKLQEEAPQLAENFALYQEMAGYVDDLVECFDMKVAHIELLDGRMVELYKARAQKLASRRQLDVRDQCDEYSALAREISKGVSAEYLSEKNNSDEAKLRRAAEREGRRMRRRKKRERTGPLISKHQDGMSSDDEEADVDKSGFREKREIILREADTIFEDVVEDFGTLEGVMLNFEKWKSHQVLSYCEAYVPLCLPKTFGTFVKLALLDWNPLKEERDLEKTNWFHQLARYGTDFDLKEDEVDPDLNLLPGVMEKVILTKITTYVQNAWNPLSHTETSRLVSLLKNLSESYPTIHGKSKLFQNCLKAVTSQINKSIDDDLFLPYYPKELLENRSLGASDFFQRQFWLTLKFLQNILLWEGIIAEEPLQQLSLACVLNRYLLLGLNTSSLALKDTSDKCKMIIGSLPKSWFTSLKNNSTLPLLKAFSSFLMKFADTHNSVSMKRGIPSDEIKDTIKDIVQLLLNINSPDDAVRLAKKYSISVFKNSQ